MPIGVTIIMLAATLAIIFFFQVGFWNSFLIIASLWFIVIFVFRGQRWEKQQDDVKRRFVEEEDAANSVRKKEIPPEMFYSADLTRFAPIPEGDPHKVERCAKRKMIRFPEPITNLELKKQYGPAQMESLALYEENFNEYLKALTTWAGALVEKGELNDALTILDEAISLGSEFRNTYRLTADIYAMNNSEIDLQGLRHKVNSNHFRDPAVLQHILEYIDNKLPSEW